MKQRSFLMRVLFCKIQCPSFFSICKPSRAPHLYNPEPLKSENTQYVPASDSTVFSSSDDNGDDRGSSEKLSANQQAENVLNSCIRNNLLSAQTGKDGKEKKKVQWVDNFGKELVEIKEFQSSNTGDNDSDCESKTCSCLVL